MNTVTISCPKCQATMIEGFIVDYTHGGKGPSRWHPGKPEKSSWTGTKVKSDQLHPVTAFRCENCGYLELYARKKNEYW